MRDEHREAYLRMWEIESRRRLYRSPFQWITFPPEGSDAYLRDLPCSETVH